MLVLILASGLWSILATIFGPLWGTLAFVVVVAELRKR